MNRVSLKNNVSILLIVSILTTVCFPARTANFAYNNLGDRLAQNGVQYTLDLNAGLTQVLADGTNTYLYGLSRIAERQGTANEYYLGDALGSVRQLTNGSGNVTLARNYEPFGKTAQTIGTAQTDYGFTGEFTDSSGLIYQPNSPNAKFFLIHFG